MAIIKLSATERRRASAFFTCLVLAIVAWVFTVMSNSYSYTVKEVLNFKNTPQRRAFHSLQSDTVNAIINGSGWQMLFSKMHNDVNPVSVDLRSLEYKSYIVLSSQLAQINEKKDPGQQLVSFNPDTLYFDFSNRKVKRVPIQLLSSLGYKHQFSQSGNITLNPAYVIVNGPANVIDNITSWKTDTLKLDSIAETITTRVNLQATREGNISVVPKNVQVNIPVDEYTEKTLEIPVKLINNNDYDDVKIFPLKVRVTFTTSLSRYAQTDEDFFEATADLDLWRKHGYKSLPVVIFKSPAYSKIVKIEPQNVDFIIKK
ncbi:YbbR-like domain-containing protein [Mucilaginibacter sp. BJC16-A38]|uniref:CdaR family protein n=1 Tax=Mucilaginibacter phenanthrenivorans TaxID=1234842 RepID=UPI002157213B|nr:YbbR-like domain-containing protein [Mucilaginibacter phenanthrenivorans]MCR8559804.1 YbbR-like domain-containing protein [Mucilaginibacter phenanthrenivorans]